MRLIILFTLIFGSAFGADITRYDGPTYPLDKADVCEQDLEEAKNVMAALDSFQFVEGSCGQVGRNIVQLKFSYAHPFTRRIERFYKRLPDHKTCDYFSRVVKHNFENMDISTIASFCIGTTLNVDYIDEDFTVFSAPHLPVQFSEETDCRKFVNKMSDKFSAQSVHTLINTCRKVPVRPFKHVYTPVMHIAASYELQVKTITGKRVAEGQCKVSEESYKTKFKDVNVDLIHAGCSKKGNSEFELLIYIKKFKGPWIKKFVGSVYSDVMECEAQLERSENVIASQGNTPIYSYCNLFNKTYSPIVYFLKK